MTAVDEAGFTIEDPESGQEVSHLFENVCALDLASTELKKNAGIPGSPKPVGK